MNNLERFIIEHLLKISSRVSEVKFPHNKWKKSSVREIKTKAQLELKTTDKLTFKTNVCDKSDHSGFNTSTLLMKFILRKRITNKFQIKKKIVCKH